MADIDSARAYQNGGKEVVHGAITGYLRPVIVTSRQHLSLDSAEDKTKEALTTIDENIKTRFIKQWPQK